MRGAGKTTTLAPLLEAFRSSPAFIDVADAIASAGTVTAVAPLRPALVAALAEREDGPWLVVVAGSREAERFAAELRLWVPDAELFPAWETLPHEKLSPRAETVARRLETLHRLRSEAPPRVVVAPVRAVIQHMVPGTEQVSPIVIPRGGEFVMDELVSQLSSFGYRRTDMVTSRGEFAVRGGIVDAFPPTEDHPIRTEFFGDTAESVRTFAVASQRSLGAADEFVAYPCRELMLTDEVRGRAIAALERHPELASELHRIADGIVFDGMESLRFGFPIELVIRALIPIAVVVGKSVFNGQKP